jgi:hypothetical protein
MPQHTRTQSYSNFKLLNVLKAAFQLKIELLPVKKNSLHYEDQLVNAVWGNNR